MRSISVIASAALLLVFCAAFTLRVSAADAPNAKAIFDEAVKAADTNTAYKFIFEYEEPAREDKKKEWRKCEFWFKTRDFMRLAVLDGDDKGAKVAINAKRSKTSAYAKASYMPVALPIKLDDERLSGFLKSDWKSDFGEISKITKGGVFTLDGSDKIKERDAYKIEVKTKDEKFDKVILFIDKKDKLILKYEYYIKGKLHSSKTWYDIQLNPEMSEKSFKP